MTKPPAHLRPRRPLVTRRGLLKAGLRSSIGCLGLTGTGLLWGYHVEAGWIEVTHRRLRLPRLAAAFNGLRLVQLSDIHMDGWMTPERLDEVVRTVSRQRPDVIAITGDYVTYAPEMFAAGLAACLGKLRASRAVVAVLGNHDHWTNAAVVRGALRSAGIRELRNECRTLHRGTEQLHLCGVDDCWAGRPDIEKVLRRTPDRGCAVLLAHEPDFADRFAPLGRFDLQLSGHSHGGQIVVPGYGAPRVPHFAHRYPSGLYRVHDMLLYTNRGVGMVRPYVRLNCRPEITVFTLLAGSGNMTPDEHFSRSDRRL